MTYVLHPLMLPTNKQAAAAYPGIVDPDAHMSQARQDQATATIQAHQDYVSGRIPEVTPDPRLGSGGGGGDGGNGGGGEPPTTDLVIEAIEPTSAVENHVTSVIITGQNMGLTHGNPTIGKSCHNTLIISDIQVNTDTPGNQAAGTFPVVITLADGVTQVTGPDFTFTQAVIPEED